jgi:hypothetical protein
MMKIEVNRVPKETNQFKVNMVLTEGAILALTHALQSHAKVGSAIAQDLLDFLRPAAEKADIKLPNG